MSGRSAPPRRSPVAGAAAATLAVLAAAAPLAGAPGAQATLRSAGAHTGPAAAVIADLRPVPADTGAIVNPVVYHGREGTHAVAVPRVTGTLHIDGVLSEQDWSDAAVLTGFSQYHPVDGIAAADSTEILLLYSHHALYIGIRAFEPHGSVVATLADRDRIHADDYVHIMLDTFNDRRRALLFGVNPLGVQADGTVADAGDGRSIDLSPDFLFESKGRLTDFGYEVELRIPFKSLRYRSDPVQTWGINVLRSVAHSGHQQTWTPVLRSNPTFLGQAGTLTDLTDLRRGIVLDVNPTLTERRDGSRLSPDEFRRAGADREFGLNLRWGVTANLTANATYNPDFSQVESDVGQVVYDPRQALAFPEKRPFFLEGNENFAAPNSLIYTRRVISPVAAAKLGGKFGGTSIGLLSAVDDRIASANGDRPIINALRLRRDVASSSTIGLVYTDRIDGDDVNRVIAFDTRLVFGGSYAAVAQVGSSFTRRDSTDWNGRPIFEAQLVRTGRDWGFSSTLRGTHPEFRTATGFIGRTGIVRANLTPRRSWYPDGSPLEAIHYSTIFDGTWTWNRFRDGSEPNDMKWQNRITTQWRGGWTAMLFTFVESFLYPEELYRNYFIERRDANGAITDTVPYTGTHRLPNYGGMINIGTPQFQHFSGNAEIIFARDDNFEEWSSAWIFFASINAEWRPTDRLRINGRYLEQRFHRYSDGSLVKLQVIPRVKLEYQLARPIFIRLVGEYDGYRRDALRDDSRTNDPILIRTAAGTFAPAIAQEHGRFRGDALFSYQPSPGTVLFVGYGSTLADDEFLRPSALVRQADGFFVKLSYLYRL